MDIIVHKVNNFEIPQRCEDGYFNATAMCGAFNEDISNWLALNSTFELVTALACRLNIKPNPVNSSNPVNTSITSTYPTLVVVEKGTSNNDETWIHHKLAVQAAMWINSEFGLLVLDWVEAWLTINQKPVKSSKAIDLSPVVEAYIKSSQALNRSIHTAIHQQTDSLREALKALEEAKNIIPTGDIETDNTVTLSNSHYLNSEKPNRDKASKDQLTEEQYLWNDQQQIESVQKIELDTPEEQEAFYTTLRVFAPTRQRKGCLYKFVDKKTLSSGAEVFYPRVTGTRDPDNIKHWYWGFSWEEKVDGQWKNRSVRCHTGAVSIVMAMQNQCLPLTEIISFIKDSKRNIIQNHKFGLIVNEP
ncbi:hypothetical protein DSM106972_095530 [Dulcicalothrix desertica PCC 7102]|uniref:KilA-N domain-containing protein n=1 Tax=Dulcicalothrix desertica PCC 7102 TaxID=232991 RepID=A0A3S1A511_9CYAN|nr:KilA-N domain-containing protein [Dulcicalothrix desertica]RUS93794.1 hypothetical protein DSM106972_095530 [Dulcicalothrix desertica PCC 7102]TWH62727.1 KilA domain-containing protein [Dulcicalothrix desertica PCC 7102]